MKALIAFALLAVLMSQSSVIAHTIFGIGTFENIDVDKNGDASLEEFLRFFDSLDSNYDGLLTEEEITSHMSPESKKSFKGKFSTFYDKLDGEIDNAIQRNRAVRNLHKFLDKNRDGKVFKEEFKQGLKIGN